MAGHDRKHIAVVDDDETTISIYQSMLQDRYDIFTTTDPELFLKHIRKNPPDLLIVDLLMPEMDGLELVHIVSRDFDIPTIAVSSTSDSSTISKALHDFNAYIYKPLKADELLATIEDNIETQI